MSLSRKQVAWLIAAIGLVYFAIFAVPNARGAKSESMLQATSQDEPITYPYVVRMLTPAKDLKDLFTRWVIYGDYHYGYPFYFLSAVAVLPVRLIYGGLFTNHTAINLWLLRQLISVLPMLLAAVLLVYTHTRFERPWASLAILAVLITTRAVVINNIQWWHPDALSVFFVALTFFFLARDNLRFGRNFLLAAAACGVAAGIKFAGFFFFLVILGYLAAGLIKKVLTWKKGAIQAGLFVGVMAAALVLSNPFLYNQGARQELVKIQTYKNEELSQGYPGHDDPVLYSKGPGWWEWTLTTWYGNLVFMGFLLVSLGVGCVWGPNKLLNRLILLWIVPFSIYLFYFVAVKPSHYWLPVMLPLFSTALNIPIAIQQGWIPKLSIKPWVRPALVALVGILLAVQVGLNIAQPFSGAVVRYQEGLRIEETLSQK